MFKLVGVGGAVRGKSYDIGEGSLILGRSEAANIRLNYEGISKNHFKISNMNGSLILEDLGSSNGTFLNEKLIKTQYLKIGDVVSVPGAIFRVVKGKKDNSFAMNGGQEDGKNLNSFTSKNFEDSIKEDSGSILVKLIKKHILKIIYDFNGKYQWSSIIVILISLFTLSNIFFTIGPVLDDAHKMLITELRLRAKQYVDEVERTNAVMLSRLQIDNINDLSLRQAESDIQSYLIFDASGRVIRPVDKLNTHVNDTFAVGLMNWSKQNEDNAGKIFARSIGEGEIGVGKAIKVLNIETQRENIVGYVAIKFRPVTLTTVAMSNRLAYVKALIISGLSAVIFFILIYYLTTRPIEEITWQTQQANIGRQFENKTNYLMVELRPLRKAIEQTFQRLTELTTDQGDGWKKEDEAPYYEKLFQMLSMLQGEGMVLDANKSVLYINPTGEDLLGLRESMSQGSSLLDVMRDQGLAAQILQLCEDSFLDAGQVKDAEYEIKGLKVKIAVMTMIGKDKEAKGYLSTFKKV
jgi:hypothetical protein